jgi:hypothetical protein
MIQHRFALALAALALSVGLTDVANAYPTAARSGTSTVTGAYRPLDFDLLLVPGPTSVISYDPPSFFQFSAVFNGRFSASAGASYTASGDAGEWFLRLGTNFSFNGVSVEQDPDTHTISLTANAVNTLVGPLTYRGGGAYDSVPYQDSPQVGDVLMLTVPGSTWSSYNN